MASQDFRIPAPLDPWDDEAVKRSLRDYFFGNDEKRPNEGASFNTLGHGWREPGSKNVLTAFDLLSLSTLSVAVEAASTVAVLQSGFLDDCHELLVDIPVSTRIVDDRAWDLLGSGGAAHALWNKFTTVPGFGDTRASKLLARKRPLLVPIYDDFVRAAVGIPNSHHFWEPMRDSLMADESTLYKRAEAARIDLGLPDDITPLRVIDVVLWRVGATKMGPRRTGSSR